MPRRRPRLRNDACCRLATLAGGGLALLVVEGGLGAGAGNRSKMTAWRTTRSMVAIIVSGLLKLCCLGYLSAWLSTPQGGSHA